MLLFFLALCITDVATAVIEYGKGERDF
jgi:hypothetical protein